MGKLNILQINIEGLQHKATELLKTLHIHDVHIVLIQETILPKFEIKTPGYTQTKCDCHNCRGIMTLIRNDVLAEVKNLPLMMWMYRTYIYGLEKHTYQYDISTVR